MKTSILFLLLISLIAFSQQKTSPNKRLVFWGDSMTQGAGSSLGWNWENQMQQYFYAPRVMKINARGGITSTQIAALAGGIPFYITVASNTLTTSYTTVTTQSTGILETRADLGTRVISGTVVVNGNSSVSKARVILKRTATGTVPNPVELLQIMTPMSSNAVVGANLPANSIFLPDEAVNTRGDVNIYWMGRNDGDYTVTLANVIATVSKLESPQQFIVIGILPATSETNGTSNRILIDAYNTALKARYPNNYVEVYPPSTDEMAIINFTPTSQDLIDISNGVFPASMHPAGDVTHLNNTGQAIIAYRVAQKIISLGY